MATNAGHWHPDMPTPNWPQYPSGDLAQYNGGYANLADQILASYHLADGLSSSPFYGQGAGRYAYAQGMGDGKAFPKNAGRSAPWLGNGLFPSFPASNPAPTNTQGGGLLNSQPVPSVTVNGKPPTKVDATPAGSGLLGAPATNGGAGGATNANYIPGVNLAWGSVPSVGDPVNQYGAPTGRDLDHLWGVHSQGDDAQGYVGPVTNMSQSRYAQYMSDLAQGITRDESTGMGYINGQPVK